jgi:Transglutaminase-like domain
MGATPDSGADSLPLEITVVPVPVLVYASLHNDAPLFHTFRIRQVRGQVTLSDVRIEVALDIGPRIFPYRQRVNLSKGSAELGSQIRLGLIWEELSHFRDPVRSLLHVDVYLGAQRYFEESYTVILLPVEEWLDVPDAYPWLPSHIRPHEPAIEEVVIKARKYLAARAGDPDAGFTGYLMATATEPEPVDEQVQALWAAIVHDSPVNYIGPMAGAETLGQHIRTPSEVFRTRQGTCLDLALMFAACLEHVGINAVVFLYTGHANMGYWRSAAAFSRFEDGELITSPSTAGWVLGAPTSGRTEAAGAATAASRGSTPNPKMTAAAHQEIKRLIGDGLIVPVETTYLSKRTGLIEAAEEATRKLTAEQSVEAMIDVRTARVNRVWPVPLRGGSA